MSEIREVFFKLDDGTIAEFRLKPGAGSGGYNFAREGQLFGMVSMTPVTLELHLRAEVLDATVRSPKSKKAAK